MTQNVHIKQQSSCCWRYMSEKKVVKSVTEDLHFHCQTSDHRSVVTTSKSLQPCGPPESVPCRCHAPSSLHSLP